MSHEHNHDHHHEMSDKDLTISWMGNAAISAGQFVYAVIERDFAMAGRAVHNAADAVLMRLRQVARADSSKLETSHVNIAQVGMGTGEIGLGYTHYETAHDDEFVLASQIVSGVAVMANAYFLRLHLKYHNLKDLIKDRDIAHLAHVTTDFASEVSHSIGLGIGSDAWQGASEVVAGNVLALGGIIELGPDETDHHHQKYSGLKK